MNSTQLAQLTQPTQGLHTVPHFRAIVNTETPVIDEVIIEEDRREGKGDNEEEEVSDNESVGSEKLIDRYRSTNSSPKFSTPPNSTVPKASDTEVPPSSQEQNLDIQIETPEEIEGEDAGRNK